MYIASLGWFLQHASILKPYLLLIPIIVSMQKLQNLYNESYGVHITPLIINRLRDRYTYICRQTNIGQNNFQKPGVYWPVVVRIWFKRDQGASNCITRKLKNYQRWQDHSVLEHTIYGLKQNFVISYKIKSLHWQTTLELLCLNSKPLMI